MATYADFLSSLIAPYQQGTRAQYNSRNPAQGVQFAVSSILQQREAEKNRKLAEEQSNLDKAKFQQNQREFFTKTLEGVQSDLASGVPERVQRAEMLLRSAGGQVEGEAAETAAPSEPEQPEKKAEPQQAKGAAQEVVEETTQALAPLGSLESLASISGGVAEEGGEEVLSLEPMTITAGEPQEEALLPNVQIKGHFGVTEGMPQSIPLVPGALPETLVRQPAPDLDSGDPSNIDESSPVVGYSETEDGEKLPLRMADPGPVETTTRRVLDPFGNEVGVINLGGTDAMVDRAMQSLQPSIEAWSDSLPEAPIEALQSMAREQVRAILSSYDGSLKDGVEEANDQLNTIFKTLHQNMRSEMHNEAFGALGIGQANKGADIMKGVNIVKKMGKEKGYDELGKMNEDLTNSVNATYEMLADIKAGRPVNTSKFGQILFTLAHANDKGKLSNQDFIMSVGDESLVEKLKSFVAKNFSMTEAQHGLSQILKGATIPAMKIRRIQRHLEDELVRTKRKIVAAKKDATALYQDYSGMGALSIANGIAATANRLFGADLPIISQQEAMRRAQAVSAAAKAQQQVNQQHRQRVQQAAQQQMSDPAALEGFLQELGH